MDIIIIGSIGVAFLAAVRHMRKNGTGCGGCSGDCASCGKKKK